MSDLLYAFSTIVAIYRNNKDVFLLAKKYPQNINYLVGKVMVACKGDIDPEFVLKIIKAIVDSDYVNKFNIEVVCHDIKGGGADIPKQYSDTKKGN